MLLSPTFLSFDFNQCCRSLLFVLVLVSLSYQNEKLSSFMNQAEAIFMPVSINRRKLLYITKSYHF